MNPQSFPLPHGATGIEIGDFVIEFRDDKIIALAKHTGEPILFTREALPVCWTSIAPGGRPTAPSVIRPYSPCGTRICPAS